MVLPVSDGVRRRLQSRNVPCASCPANAAVGPTPRKLSQCRTRPLQLEAPALCPLHGAPYRELRVRLREALDLIGIVMTASTLKRSRVTQPDLGESAIRSSQFSAGSPSESRLSAPIQASSGPPANRPCTSNVTSPVPPFPPPLAKQAWLLPPRMPSHTTLVALFGLPSRISLIVKPLPMPCSTRSASSRFDLPLPFAPTSRFIRPSARSTRRRLLKFSMTMRSITSVAPFPSASAGRLCRGRPGVPRTRPAEGRPAWRRK